MTENTKQSIRANAKTQGDYYKGDEGNRTKKAHTPTPWQFGNCIVKGKKWIEISKQNSASFALFISPYINNFNSEEIQANAAFIVRAVNSHEKLLAACKASLSKWDEYITNSGDDNEELLEYMGDLREAILKAEAK